MIKIASFNVQGLNNKYKQRTLGDDFIRLGVDVMAIQETKIQKQESIQIQASDGTRLTLHNSGHSSRSWKGVGILVKDSTKISFKPISERICIAQIKQNNEKMNIMSVYSPTEEETVKKPESTNSFYNRINSVINGINKRDNLIIGGDFNARTKIPVEERGAQEATGMYARNEINENGRKLIEFCKINNLMLSNTMFKHKPSQQVTWESAVYPKGKRRNPYRFQIDYIAVRRKPSGLKMIDSRAYNGLLTTSDHKPVIMKVKTHHPTTIEETKTKSAKLKLEDLQIPELKKEYQEKVEGNLLKLPVEEQSNWDTIAKVVKETAAEVVGFRSKTKEFKNERIKHLSEKQLEMSAKINSNKDPEKRLQLRKERNKLLTRLHNEIKIEETERLNRKMEPLEGNSDSRSMFNVVKELRRSKPKRKLMMKQENGMLTTDEEEQAKLIADHFKKIFFKGSEQYKKIAPMKMKRPFTGEEVYYGAGKISNNRSAGCDDVYAELIKNAPEVVHDRIADLLNNMAESGIPPREVILGIIYPLEKSKTKIGETDNLRPITLLTVLRKILANMMIQRIRGRLDENIPKSQAAYRSGRSTTEHVFAVKLTAERMITSKDEEIHLIMLDMSKAFDSMNRRILLENLSEVIDEDELHIIQLMLDVKMTVRCGDKYSEVFDTDTGGPQGDSGSANQFTFYLSKALMKYYKTRESTKVVQHSHLGDHQYSKKTEGHMEDHQYSKAADKEGLEIDMQYADDLTELNTNHQKIQHLKKYLPEALDERDLKLNLTKTEEYLISGKNDRWKNCKLLGSYIDTERDIGNRKSKTITAANDKELQDIFNNKNVSTKKKVDAFNIYIGSIFLYNSELWTMNESLNEKVDSFHRHLLRKFVLKVKYPEVITNKELYEITKVEPWSRVIGRRRLCWFGHVSRLDEETPAKIALRYALQDYQKKPGRPKQTWLKVVEKQLREINIVIPLEEALEQAQDRKEWDKKVKLWSQKVAAATRTVL